MKKRIVFIAAVALAVLLVSAAQAAGGVKLDAAHFPDPLFRAEMKEYDENSDGTLSAKEIAAISNVNVTGKPVTSYIRESRVLIACNLLKNTKDSLAEISGSLGFSSQSYFIECFILIIRILVVLVTESGSILSLGL